MRVSVLHTMLLGAATASCSFILDYDSGQCNTQADCDELAAKDPRFIGTQCTSEQICSLADGGTGGQGAGTPGCVSSEQCTADNNGQPYICKEGACVPLLSEDCIEVIGNYQDDNAIIMGFMHLIAGSQLFDFLHRAFGCSLDLAVTQFDNSINGLPNPDATGGVRPLVFVMCNEGANRERATNHLIE